MSHTLKISKRNTSVGSQESLEKAVASFPAALIWENTEEGRDYWSGVYHNLKSKLEDDKQNVTFRLNEGPGYIVLVAETGGLTQSILTINADGTITAIKYVDGSIPLERVDDNVSSVRVRS